VGRPKSYLPTLFLVLINDIVKDLSCKVQGTILVYADDVINETYTVFSLSFKEKKATLCINGQTLLAKDNLTYLR
jgi:hypothetical protein